MYLTPAQKEIAKDATRFRVVNCGRRFGKTTLAVEEIKGKAISKESRIVYIAPTYQQARDIAFMTLLKELKGVIKKVNDSRLEITIRTIDKGESMIFLRGWEAIESLRGQAFDFLVVDEVAMMRNFWSSWQEVLRPTLTDRRGEVLFISTPKGFNHFYELYMKEKEDTDFKSFHFTSFDNPYLPRDEIEKAQQQMTDTRFEQEYLANFRKTEGLVYKEFNRDKHIINGHKNQIVQTISGVDWGYTNPACVLKIEKDTDRRFYVMEEWYKTGQSTEQIIEIAKQFDCDVYYPDPAEPDRCEMLRKSGCNVRETNKDIVAGIDCVRELFKQNRLFIHSSCKNLIYELETYHYPEKRADRNEPEKPVKENDHAVDALRYPLYSNEPMLEEYEEDFGLYRTTYV